MKVLNKKADLCQTNAPQETYRQFLTALKIGDVVAAGNTVKIKVSEALMFDPNASHTLTIDSFIERPNTYKLCPNATLVLNID